MQNEERDLRDRTKHFVLCIVEMFSVIPKTTEAKVLGKQTLRSGTSVGANYREAYRGRSKAEFIAKCGDSLRELEETAYWLELLVDGKIVAPEKLAALRQRTHRHFRYNTEAIEVQPLNPSFVFLPFEEVRLRGRLPQNQCSNNTNAQKADDLDEHVAGGVNTRKAIPVPIGNVGRDGGEYSGNQNEADSAEETRDARLDEEEHDEDRFEQFGAEFDSEPFAKRERAPGRMIHEDTGRTRRHFFAHVFHRFVLFLSGCVLADAGTRKNVKAGLFADAALHCAEHG